MMGAELKVKVEIPEYALKNKLNHLVKDEATMLEIHNLFAKMMDPYVPFLEGPLSQTIQVTSDGVRYVQPYAHYQYYGVDFNHTLDYHPLASAMWDKAMLAANGDSFIEQVRAILARRIKNIE